MMTLHLLNVLMGFLAGLMCSCGGALKDSPYEGFQIRKFFRSTIVGACMGALSSFVTTNLLLAFVFSGYMERVAVEGWKIIRAQRPGKFNLPHPSMLGRRLGLRKTRFT